MLETQQDTSRPDSNVRQFVCTILHPQAVWFIISSRIHLPGVHVTTVSGLWARLQRLKELHQSKLGHLPKSENLLCRIVDSSKMFKKKIICSLRTLEISSDQVPASTSTSLKATGSSPPLPWDPPNVAVVPKLQPSPRRGLRCAMSKNPWSGAGVTAGHPAML